MGGREKPREEGYYTLENKITNAGLGQEEKKKLMMKNSY